MLRNRRARPIGVFPSTGMELAFVGQNKLTIRLGSK